MVGLISSLVSEFVYEAFRFVIMLVLLVLAVLLGSKIRKAADARKALKNAEAEKDKEITE